jgi:hypothetical protein
MHAAATVRYHKSVTVPCRFRLRCQIRRVRAFLLIVTRLGAMLCMLKFRACAIRYRCRQRATVLHALKALDAQPLICHFDITSILYGEPPRMQPFIASAQP